MKLFKALQRLVIHPVSFRVANLSFRFKHMKYFVNQTILVGDTSGSRIFSMQFQRAILH